MTGWSSKGAMLKYYQRVIQESCLKRFHLLIVTSSIVLASHHLFGQDQKCTSQWHLAMHHLLLLSLLLVGLRPSSSQTSSQDGKPSGFQRFTGLMLPPFWAIYLLMEWPLLRKKSWAISVLLIFCWYNWVENKETLVSSNYVTWHLTSHINKIHRYFDPRWMQFLMQK